MCVCVYVYCACRVGLRRKERKVICFQFKFGSTGSTLTRKEWPASCLRMLQFAALEGEKISRSA